jgi:hypothetical protein
VVGNILKFIISLKKDGMMIPSILARELRLRGMALMILLLKNLVKKPEMKRTNLLWII